MLDVLQTQRAALEAKRLEEKRLVAEEALLLKEEIKLRALEEQRMRQDKKDRQNAHKYVFFFLFIFAQIFKLSTIASTPIFDANLSMGTGLLRT